MTTGFSVYEQVPLPDLSEDTLHPGGLALTDAALTFCNLPSGARILDVGCGPALTVQHLMTAHQLNALGIDPSASLLHAGRRRNSDLPLIQAAGEALPFAAKTFDALITECSLSEADDPDRALAEFWRVVRPGGYLVLSDLYVRNPERIAALRQLPFKSCLRGAMAQEDIRERVAVLGFAICRWEDQTNALKVFTAQWLWKHGSLFWCRGTSPEQSCTIQGAIAGVKFGYFLLIAQRMEG